jgi:hypothetical protein
VHSVVVRDARCSAYSCSPLCQLRRRAGILLASFSCALWCWPVSSSISLPSPAVTAPIHGARHLHSMVLADNTECVVADPTAAISCSVMATGHRALTPGSLPLPWSPAPSRTYHVRCRSSIFYSPWPSRQLSLSKLAQLTSRRALFAHWAVRCHIHLIVSS